jgi:hypothetical protein
MTIPTLTDEIPSAEFNRLPRISPYVLGWMQLISESLVLVLEDE